MKYHTKSELIPLFLFRGILRASREASRGNENQATFGPFKLVGGIAKGHPTEEEIDACVKFYKELPEG